ncbi:MAG: hypothetical protein U9N35_03140 [Euryarchaeota archaeon]|nr:hypothetical protein [Euryarchaeota archaeon]
MNKIIWVLIGIVLIAVGVYTLIPQGLNWWVEFRDVFKGVIGVFLMAVGAFCLFIAKID